MFKARIWAFVALLLLPFAVTAHEIEAKPTTIAVYIQAQDYNYQLRLHHYSTGYWYSQGPMLEEAAMEIQRLKATLEEITHNTKGRDNFQP